MPNLTRDQGIVLSARDFAETDRILSLLTPGHGKVAVLAKGVRRTTSPTGAYLDLLNRVEAIYYVRRNLNLLRDASLVEHFATFHQDLERAEAALGGAQLASRLVPEGQANPRAFDLTVSFLRTLDRGAPIAPVEVSYRLHLLASLGHRPHLAGCVNCGGEEDLTWSPDKGGLLCVSCGGEGDLILVPLWKSLRILATLPVEDAGRVRLDPELVPQGRNLIERFTDYQVRR
ncbi:MAG: DNA repair protein RecO [Candidatus Bipolaricaulis sp.]|nr:DNA repair protein RecO [Candidatus Bipolaricaulis sp.]